MRKLGEEILRDRSLIVLADRSPMHISRNFSEFSDSHSGCERSSHDAGTARLELVLDEDLECRWE